MPHVPLYTQPIGASLTRLSPYPIIESLPDIDRKNFVQSTIIGRAARGLASIEYVLESVPDHERQKRLREVEDAVQWEKEMRRRRVAIDV